jgi:ribonuclease HI
MITSDPVEIYTDGSFPWPSEPEYHTPTVVGSWAYAIVFKGNTIEKVGLYGFDGFKSTNNRCEMMGIIQALEALNRQTNKIIFQHITVFTDSQYAEGSFSRKYRLKAKTKNLDLIHRCLDTIEELKQKGSEVKFQWIKGHNGNKYNEVVDELAGECLKKYKQEKLSR